VASEDAVLPIRVAEDKKRVIYEKEAKSFEKFESDDVQQMGRRYRIVCQNLRLMSIMGHVLNPLAMGFFSVKFWSHKMLRWLVPFYLIALFLINVALLGQGTGFKVFFFMQAWFYASALLYPFFKRMVSVGILQKLFYAIFFFCLSNLGILMGFLYYFKGEKFKEWVRQR